MGFKTILLLSASLALLAVGCGDDENDDDGSSSPFEPIEVSVSESLLVDWEGGGVGEIRVVECAEAFDSCPNNGVGCSGSTPWLVRADRQIDNPIMAPQPYGASLFERPGADPADLEPGRTYSLAVARFRECDPPRDGCGSQFALGCTLFVP